jgi:carbonic anhydrase
MTVIETLLERNAEFAAHEFSPGLSILPKLRSIIITCADSRVDPAYLLGIELGEAIVIRNIAGRIAPSTLQTLGMLGGIGQAEGVNTGDGLNLIVLQHTDCGINRLAHNHEMLAGYFGISKEEVATKTVTDPRQAVAGDIAALRANPNLPDGWIVSGLVYNVATGLIDTVVAPAPLRETANIA